MSAASAVEPNAVASVVVANSKWRMRSSPDSKCVIGTIFSAINELKLNQIHISGAVSARTQSLRAERTALGRECTNSRGVVHCEQCWRIVRMAQAKCGACARCDFDSTRHYLSPPH